jgi:hypothetical protein
MIVKSKILKGAKILHEVDDQAFSKCATSLFT